ncbi:hypothetical protein ACOMHN_008571 [Nucella lapillus]
MTVDCTTCACLHGQTAGLLWQQNFLKIQSLVFVPRFVSRTFDGLFGRWLRSGRPRTLDSPLGATLELQRQERLERLEEQMLESALRGSSALGTEGAMDRRLPQPSNLADGPGIFGNFLRNAGIQRRSSGMQHSAGDDATVSEDQVQQLIEMGFNDNNVRRALQLADNDISRATAVLLQEAS